MSYRDPAPNPLLSDELPQDHVPPSGPNWHIRAKVRELRDGLTDQEWKDGMTLPPQDPQVERATARLALPCNDELRLQRAIASLAAQLAQPEPEEASVSALTVEDQLRELQYELDGKALPIRSVEQKLRYL